MNCTTSEGSCGTTEEVQPKIIQMNDKKLYIFFSIWTSSCTGGCLENLFFLSNPILSIHDVGISGIPSLSTNNLRATQTLTINSNITNTGDFDQSVTVTILANNTIVATNSSQVKTGKSVIVVVKWKTHVTPGRFIITVKTNTTLESLPNLADNAATLPGVLLIRPVGDVNGDCLVDISDIVLVAAANGQSVGNPGFNPAVDVNGDGTIDISDLVLVAADNADHC